MKSLCLLIALLLFTPTFLHADVPLNRKPVSGNETKQAVAQVVRKTPHAHVQPGTFEILKRVSSQQKLMERQRRETAKFQAARKEHPAVVRVHHRQAEFLGKRIPFLRGPDSSPGSKPQMLSRIATTTTTNALINGKTADTVEVGDNEVLTFSFAPGYVSAALLIYYDADNDGLVSDKDLLLSSSILLMDNDENDADPAPGKYSLRSGVNLSLTGLVGSYILSVNDFQTLSTAHLVVLQKPAAAIVHIATNPPVPNLLVQVYAGSLLEILFTDSAGRADVTVDRLASPQPEFSLYDFKGNAGAYIPPANQFPLLSSDTTDILFSYIAAPSSLRGVYLDNSGAPIPGAQVYAYGSYDVRTTTDASGTFRLGVTSGTWYVSVQPPSADYMLTNSSAAVSVASSDSTVHLGLVGVKANSTISGTVHYLSGGVGGVLVDASQDSLSNTILTGADGSYTLPVWKPQTGSDSCFVYPYLGIYTYFVIETSPKTVLPGAQNVNFTLSRVTGGMAGKVIDERTGFPLAGATLSLWGPVYISCTTDDSGSYRVPLEDGNYWVYVYAQGYFSYSSSNVVVVAGGIVTLDFLLTPCGVISGIIRDKEGRGIPGLNISAHDSTGLYYGSASSDVSGKYVMNNLHTGSYVVSAYGGPYAAQFYQNTTDPLQAKLVAVQEGFETPNIDFVLTLGGSVAGKVTDKNGVPIPGAYITVYDTNYMARSSAYSSDSGFYVASGLATGNYLVYVYAYPYLSVWYDNAPTFGTASKVHVVVEDTTFNINFSLLKGASLAGEVWDDQKKPLSGVWVYAVDTLGLGYGGQYTNESGRYQIAGLPANVYKATAQSGYAPQWYDHKASFETADTIRLALGQDRGGIDFDLRRWPGISGSLVDDSSGADISNATISMICDDGNSYSTTADYSGTYGLTLSPGNYSIRASCEAGNYSCRYYYRSEGFGMVERDADKISVTANSLPSAINFRLPADKKEFAVTSSDLDITMTNRGMLGNLGDSAKPSCRWPTPQGKDYLFESDFWVGGSFGGVNRQFGDFYGGASGRWHASTNFTEPEDKDFETVQTWFYNTDYAYWRTGMSVVTRQELDAWPTSDFVLSRHMLFHDANPADSPPAISGLYAGLFADFDISNRGQTDLVGIDTADGLIYMYESGKADSACVGACLLGSHRAMFTWWNVRSDSAHYSESARQQLLMTDEGVSVPTQADDYRVLVSTGPYTLNPGDSLDVSMAFVAGKGKQAIIAAAQAARAKYIALTTGVTDLLSSRVPSEFGLSQNYPNPFNPRTTIRYEVPQKSRLTLSVYNLLGQQVSILVQGEQEAGHHEVRFDGSNLASGVYFYRLQAGSFVETKKLLLLK
jgi:Carboxypeptidase regulatory-like domain/Secretion system C-terminal sorting domain